MNTYKLWALAAVAVLLVMPQSAPGVIVDRLIAPFDATPVNITVPGRDTQFDATGIEDDDPTTVIGGDPGWFNVPENRSGIYLGNQWFLTAAHTFNQNSGPLDVVLNGRTYQELPGTRTILENTGSTRQFSVNSDLVLFRLGTNNDTGVPLTPEADNANVKTLGNADPDRLLTIASGTHAVNDEVLMIGVSNTRVVNTADENGHTFFDESDWAVSASGTAAGFRQTSNRTKVWGTNTIAPDSDREVNSLGNPVNDGVFNNDILVDVFGRVTVTQITRFDAGQNEGQGAPGSSGGPVFVRNSQNEWELGGIMHAIFLEEGQPTNISVFGNHTAFTDIGNTRVTYRSQILELAGLDFSLSGDDFTGSADVDLDGEIDLDDLDALAAGWTDPETTPSLHTWLRGDINQDGDTDLADFALLRESLGSGIGLGQLNAAIAAAGALNVSVVPEPASALLAVAGAGLLLAGRRRR